MSDSRQRRLGPWHRSLRHSRHRRPQPAHARVVASIAVGSIALASAAASVGYSALPVASSMAGPSAVRARDLPELVAARQPPGSMLDGRGTAALGPAAIGSRQPAGLAAALPTPGSSGPIPQRGPGRFVVAPGGVQVAARGRLVRYTVEVEQGLGISPVAVAAIVDGILADGRGWRATGYDFRRTVGGGDLRIVLATPGTTDKLCAPLLTRGEVSCRNGGLAVLNLRRWLLGAPAYGADLVGYRRYLVNHEVGHFLGRGHLRCPGPGRYAPVMLQQTRGLDGCRPNPWPTVSDGR